MSDGQDVSFTREQIVELLTELGAELDAHGVQAQLFVVGGAAIALAFNTRRTTGDVDGVFEPKTLIYEAARRVAARHASDKVPADWLNDGVKGLLPGVDPGKKVILDLPGLVVSVPSPRYLLALKVQAARIDRDQDDIRFLAKECGVSTADEVLAIAEGVIGRERLMPKAQFLVQEMFPQPRPNLSEHLALWNKGRRARRPAHPKKARQPKPAKPEEPPLCSGHTKQGQRCLLRTGHGGHCRGQ